MDPKATGVVVLGVGAGTKLLHGLLGCDKEYTASGVLGIATDTLDLDTNATVVETRAVPTITEHQIAETVERFVGRIEQMPPQYSALRVGQYLSLPPPLPPPLPRARPPARPLRADSRSSLVLEA